jgi:PAS domain S-box-containing protein
MVDQHDRPEDQPQESGPSREELLYQSGRTRVYRVRRADKFGTVICKEPVGSGAVQRLRHETTLLARLAGVPGIPLLSDAPTRPGVIALANVGATTLAQIPAPMPVPQLLNVGARLARTLAGVHRRGVVHKDVNPANVVLAVDGTPYLIDFDLATTFAEERPGFTHQNNVAGTLAYLAPEQTGRTSRPVDRRADLYALGATLYALATGQPPFGQSSDPLQLIHSHLAAVPEPPINRNPALPPTLSRIIQRLLEKEPDRRYQSAEGVAYDLERLRADPGAEIVLGERDFPERLVPPSRLIGRETETQILATAFAAAATGPAGAVLVTGEPGVGKTGLIDELRPIATAAGGWFVAGKFDQHRRDVDADAVQLAVRALARLLLAEPETALDALRARIRDALGANIGLLTEVHPELAVLLGPTETVPTEAVNLEDRLIQAVLDLLRVVATRNRPVVLILDDLQWANATALGVIDALLTDDTLTDLLLVGTYRNTEVDETHPLSAMLARWQRLARPPTLIRLTNLPPAELSTLLAETLRLAAGPAAQLAEVIGARTGGNPYDTIELVNALRRDDVIMPENSEWSWDEAEIRRYVGRGDVLDLLTTRIQALPPDTGTLLGVLACLGGQVSFDLLRAAADRSADEVEYALGPALEDGLLVLTRDGGGGQDTVSFRHDRVQQVAYACLSASEQPQAHLGIARHLIEQAEYITVAAEQYLHTTDVLTDPHERRQVAHLFHAAATASHLTNPAATERFLATAVNLIGEPSTDEDCALVAALDVERHATLYRLGRLAEADVLYETIVGRHSDPLELTDPMCVQIASLTNRGLFPDAVTLGLHLLTQLGLAVPGRPDLLLEIGRGLARVDEWVSSGIPGEDFEVPETTDRRALATAKAIDRTLPAAFFCDQEMVAWLTLEAQRLWNEYGPAAPLVSNLGGLQPMYIKLRGDYRTGSAATRHVLAVGEARGYEPATSVVRSSYAAFCLPWLEPLEESARQAQWARERLLRFGEMQFACFTYITSFGALFDTAPTLDVSAAELDADLAFCVRTGNDNIMASFVVFRQLVRALRGDTDTPGGFVDTTFDETSYLAGLAANPMAALNFHLFRALAAALFNRPGELGEHISAAAPLLSFTDTTYPAALLHVLHGLALAEQLRSATTNANDTVGDTVDGELVAQLDRCCEWLAGRAAEAPGNFRHLWQLLEAERAWARREYPTAARSFSTALDEARDRARPWHRALITERAAAFHLTHNMAYTGRLLLEEAHRQYQEWGATGKVRDLERTYPFLRVPEAVQRTALNTGQTMTVSAASIDLLGVLQAAQALSSETNLDRLRDRVVDVLRTLTGATEVQVLLWDHDAQGWFLPAGNGEAPLSVEQAGAAGVLPLSVFRYAERTRQPLLVDDTSRDDRFARDPYLDQHGACSLLAVPILTQGSPRAMLMLENRLGADAFSADRLDAVMLIAGQLAVSLDNALAERFRSLVQRSADLTVVCDRDGVLGYASPAADEVLGLDAAAVLGRPLGEFVHPDDRPELLARIREPDHPGGESLQCRVVQTDGSTLWVEVTFKDLSGDPAVRGVMLRLRDITERRRLELELRHAQKLESVGRLSAGIAHEINTPVQFIGSNVQFLREAFTDLIKLRNAEQAVLDASTDVERAAAIGKARELADEMDLEFLLDEVPSAVAQTLEGVERVAQIVRAMKAFGHPGGEDKTLADLNEAVRNTLVVANNEIKYVADVELDLGEVPLVRCYLGDIGQVVLNLVVNAAHAITAADRGRGQLTVRTYTDGDDVCIDVTDTGTGIAPDIADKVFDPFFTTKEVGSGTGQGLALTRSLVVDRHRGFIGFTTEPGEGTTFTVRLPVDG